MKAAATQPRRVLDLKILSADLRIKAYELSITYQSYIPQVYWQQAFGGCGVLLAIGALCWACVDARRQAVPDVQRQFHGHPTALP